MPAIVVACIAQSCLISFQVSLMLRRSDIAQSKAYCDRLIPELERYKQANGRYPRRLDEIPVADPLPTLLRKNSFFSSDGGVFSFTLPASGPFSQDNCYNSRTGEWTSLYFD
jgi:hypothetical protein